MVKLTEQIIRDILMDNSIWLDDDMVGWYDCDGFKCYISFNKREDGFEIVRQISELPYVEVTDMRPCPAEREIKTVEDLNKAFENIFNLPTRLLDLFYEF